MSKERYLVELLHPDGLAASPHVPVCLVEAVDLVTRQAGVDHEIYINYALAFIDQQTGDVNSRTTEEVRNEVFAGVGVNFSDVVWRRARKPEECEEMLEKLARGGHRILARVSSGEDRLSGHVVGLRPRKEGWQMVGSFTPAPAGETLTADELFAYLLQSPERSKGQRPRPVANIIALPPEPKAAKPPRLSKDDRTMRTEVADMLKAGQITLGPRRRGCVAMALGLEEVPPKTADPELLARLAALLR